MGSFWDTRSRWTFGAQLGFALENGIPRNLSHIALVIAQPHVRLIVHNFDSSRFPVSRFSIVSEGIIGNAVHPGGRMLGHALLFRLDGRSRHSVVPFFNAGAGILDTPLGARVPELSGRLQFVPQGGLGMQYFFKPQRALVFEYRYLHMSNAGLMEPNRGWNGSMVSVGFEWLLRPKAPAWRATRRSGGLWGYLFR